MVQRRRRVDGFRARLGRLRAGIQDGLGGARLLASSASAAASAAASVLLRDRFFSAGWVLRDLPRGDGLVRRDLRHVPGIGARFLRRRRRDVVQPRAVQASGGWRGVARRRRAPARRQARRAGRGEPGGGHGWLEPRRRRRALCPRGFDVFLPRGQRRELIGGRAREQGTDPSRGARDARAACTTHDDT